MTEETKNNGVASVLGNLGLGFIKLDFIRAIISKVGGRKVALALILAWVVLEIVKIAGDAFTIAHGLTCLGLGIGIGMIGIGIAIQEAAKAKAKAAAEAKKKENPDAEN